MGIDLKTDTPTEAQLSRAVDEVLGDSTYRQRALATEAEGYVAHRRIAEVIESVAR